MTATMYKFLAAGARGPFSGFAWPVPAAAPGAPGAWVEAEGEVLPGVRGAHVCRAEELAHWLHDELWEVEVEGAQLEAPDCVVAQRARLVRRVAGWDAAGAERFAEACVAHAAAAVGDGHEMLADAVTSAGAGYTALAAFCSALAIFHTSDPAEAEAAYRRERAWQSAWIAGTLIAG